MNKIKIWTLTFDDKLKFVISICILLAISVIAFSFYYILIKAKKENIYIKDFFEIKNYETNYNLTVFSNKNSNIYHIYEKADLNQNKYLYLTDNGLKIEIDNGLISITKNEVEYDYIEELNEQNMNMMSNYISFSSIIKVVKNINENLLAGNIVKVEENGKIYYEIETEEDVFYNIKYIKVEIDKYDNCLHYVTMCDNARNAIYFVDFQDFIVKNSQ